MRDLPAERHAEITSPWRAYFYHDRIRRDTMVREALSSDANVLAVLPPLAPGRCSICGGLIHIEYTHRISWFAQRVFGFPMLNTCDSHYCRTRDPRAYR